MMYSEFIEKTGYTEKYFSYEEYSSKIEPLYMNSDFITNTEFCKAFKKAYRKHVQIPLELYGSGIETATKEAYMSGSSNDFFEILENVEAVLRAGFYKQLKYGNINL